MAATIMVVGIDGSDAGERALAFAKDRTKARVTGGEEASIVVVYVIEWSPFSFQTAEENERRHKRREEELALAHERILDPAVTKARDEGFEAEGIVRHGNVADILDDIAVEKGAAQIVVGRTGGRRLRDQFFGSVSSRLAATSSVPVTIVPAGGEA